MLGPQGLTTLVKVWSGKSRVVRGAILRHMVVDSCDCLHPGMDLSLTFGACTLATKPCTYMFTTVIEELHSCIVCVITDET